jgi:hypothetical protein
MELCFEVIFGWKDMSLPIFFLNFSNFSNFPSNIGLLQIYQEILTLSPKLLTSLLRNIVKKIAIMLFQ